MALQAILTPQILSIKIFDHKMIKQASFNLQFSSNLCFHCRSRDISTVAHKYHGKTFFLTAKLSFSRQNILSHGKTFFLTAKLFSHGKTFFITAKLFLMAERSFAHAARAAVKNIRYHDVITAFRVVKTNMIDFKECSSTSDFWCGTLDNRAACWACSH